MAFDISTAITTGGGVVDTVFGFFGQSLKNKGEEIKGAYSVELAKIAQSTANDQAAYAVAKVTLDAQTKAKLDALAADSKRQTLYVVAALIAFLGILVTTVLVLRPSSQKR